MMREKKDRRRRTVGEWGMATMKETVEMEWRAGRCRQQTQGAEFIGGTISLWLSASSSCG